jgi:hypothetical protein
MVPDSTARRFANRAVGWWMGRLPRRVSGRHPVPGGRAWCRRCGLEAAEHPAESRRLARDGTGGVAAQDAPSRERHGCAADSYCARARGAACCRCGDVERARACARRLGARKGLGTPGGGTSRRKHGPPELRRAGDHMHLPDPARADQDRAPRAAARLRGGGVRSRRREGSPQRARLRACRTGRSPRWREPCARPPTGWSTDCPRRGCGRGTRAASGALGIASGWGAPLAGRTPTRADPPTDGAE